MEDLSLHILDIMENSLDARARRIELYIDEDPVHELLSLEIRDNGKGIDASLLPGVTNPFFTTRKTRSVGLGLSMLSEAAKATGGEMIIESSPGKGTQVRATFQSGHIDMKPLGDVPQTLLTLIVGHPEIEFCYHHRIAGNTFSFDTREIDADRGSPQILRAIGQQLRKGLAQLARQAAGSE